MTVFTSGNRDQAGQQQTQIKKRFWAHEANLAAARRTVKQRSGTTAT